MIDDDVTAPCCICVEPVELNPTPVCYLRMADGRDYPAHEQCCAENADVHCETHRPDDLMDRMEYHAKVVGLLASCAECRSAPWLDKEEMTELREWYDAGEDAADFAHMLLQRDTHAQEKMMAPGINGGTHLRLIA